MSVSLLVGLLTYLNLANIGSSLVLDDISFWTFWRLSWDICGLFPNNFKFPVCLPVCYLAHFLTEINVGFLQFWMRLLSQYFRSISGMFWNRSKSSWISCLSVSWFNFLLKLGKYKDISSSVWYIFLIFLETFPQYISIFF